MSRSIAPSLLAADFSCLQREIELVNNSEACFLHLDIMDGLFVPNISFGIPVVSAVKKISRKPLDVHLMISSPDSFIQNFADAGADIITVHAEAVPHLHRSIQHIRKAGAKPSVSLNPGTPPEVLQYVLADLNMVLLMTVNPGFESQEFIPGVLPKIKRLREMIDKRKLDVEIEVDGGINGETIHQVSAAGAEVFVAGSAIF